MGLSVTRKIIKNHWARGVPPRAGEAVSLRIAQTLTQDSTGTMAYLQLEALGVERVKTRLSVAYIDHNMLQAGPENADDHLYIQTAANKYGVIFSKPGNGICHQVHLERFGAPGLTLLGSDSHTPTCGGIGMLAIGAGGLDVALAMAGAEYPLIMPEVMRVWLTGSLQPYVGAKDVILEILRRLSVKGGVGKILEYGGPGVASLTVPERATIANMGAELGATSSVFPSDAVTRAFLGAQSREADFTEITADGDAEYDAEIAIDLTALEPLAALPHSPDAVLPVREAGDVKINQVAIGSCTNSSYRDLMLAASILKGKSVHRDVSLVISPGSRQVLTMLAANGALAALLAAGARILETGCGPCIGMGQAPANGAASLRTFNRNFKGRCGTETASVYLVSPETAAAGALTGRLTDPRTLGAPVPVPPQPEQFPRNDNMFIMPDFTGEPVLGPNIKPFPVGAAPRGALSGVILLKLGDNITTDQIMPSDAKLLPYRSNIPYLSRFCLTPCDADFPANAERNGGGFIVAGENYGQGSSREHAALVPLYLGVRAVIAKSFARIHKANLINAGIIPLTFTCGGDYGKLNAGVEWTFKDIDRQLLNDEMTMESADGAVTLKLDCSPGDRETLLAGGRINYYKIKRGVV